MLILGWRSRPGAVLRRVAVLFLLGSLLVSAKQHRLAPSTGAHGLTWAHNRGDWQQGEQSRRGW